jgi:predicted nucleotidyltransferase
MIAVLNQTREELNALCRKFSVRRLDVFGSAATGLGFDPDRSDLDFLVEFRPSETMGPADQYFGLLSELEELFGRDVQLVSRRGLRNPYFIESVNRTKQELYAS